MKTPFSDDLRSFRLCNPPAEKQQSSRMWPAISRRSYLGFRNNLMSIPIYPIRPYLFLSSAKIMQIECRTKRIHSFFCRDAAYLRFFIKDNANRVQNKIKDELFFNTKIQRYRVFYLIVNTKKQRYRDQRINSELYGPLYGNYMFILIPQVETCPKRRDNQKPLRFGKKKKKNFG